ncbi:MAG: short-chain fatty acid transporter [Desulfomonile tiedjei]|nr:short-chain fatty acid transporter [Desulfomonile tiedjei]
MAQTESRSAFEFLKNWGDGLTRWSERWIPDALVIVWILSMIAFVLALIWGNTTPKGAVIAWGKGFWALLEFGMQMCLIMITGYIVACTPPVRRVMDGLAGLPNSDKPWQAIMAMALFSMSTAWVQWGLSLIASAMFALFLIRRNPKTDYRLLVASAYLGLGCTWHSGLSGSATLLVNTPNNFLIQGKYLDGTIPTTETIFSPFNLILTLIVIVVVTVLMCLMHPSEEKTYKVKPELLDQLKLYVAPERPTGKLDFSDWLNWWPGCNIIIAGAGLLWLGWEVAAKGFANCVNLNNINLFFLMLGVLLHWRPWAFLKAAEDAGKATWGVIIQFPFYAGIFGLFKFTALADVIAQFFVAISTPSTFLLIIYWYSGIENYFVPSGGSKWAITAPFILPAAKQLGVSIPKTVLTYAWGDMLTDMIQPFWAIAMLAIAKLEFREIMGWLMLVFFAYFIITSVAFLIYPWI